jgi:hypothetical protein
MALAHCCLYTWPDLSTRDLKREIRCKDRFFIPFRKTMNANEFTNPANRLLDSSKLRAGRDRESKFEPCPHFKR